YAFEAVEWAAESGVTAGYGDGTFKPQQPLSKSHAVVFMERYYDEILTAEQSDDFTRADMMVLLKAINDGTLRNTGTDSGALTLTGRGSATTRAVELSFGIWDVTYRVAGNADRPFEVASFEEDYFEGDRIDDHRNVRVRSLWTDDPAAWHEIGLVGSSKPHSERGAPTDTMLHYAHRTWFEVEAEPGASWSITLTKRPWPPPASDDPDRIVVWDDGSSGERSFSLGPFDFAEGRWRWEMLIWGSAARRRFGSGWLHAARTT
ncbi:MAG: S-layer homology domain-containing protein, partial [Acidimicrobiaceae bacterium]|nr:S-layer homology domain-containing protein [Acidimicrobiaceae bacterium]